MANDTNGGRDAPENTPASWRPDEPARRYRAASEDDQRAWHDRHDPGERGYRERDDPYSDDRQRSRLTERYGQGQSGYSAGRYGDDRSQQLRMQNRNEMVPSIGSGPAGYDQRDRYYGEDRAYEERRYRQDERMGYQSNPHPRDEPGGAASWSPVGSYEAMRYARSEPHVHRGAGPHRGKGPVGYQRSDDRIRELVCESLTDDDQLDASQIEVSVTRGDVTLSGVVEDRRAKRAAEDCACSVTGVRDVQNLLRVNSAAFGGRSDRFASDETKHGSS